MGDQMPTLKWRVETSPDPAQTVRGTCIPPAVDPACYRRERFREIDVSLLAQAAVWVQTYTRGNMRWQV